MSQLIKRITKKGFTLIELMIVVAIIGILAAIAVPKFADLIQKSKESSAKGSLGGIRSAITIYYSDTEGYFPANNADLIAALTTSARYINAGPRLTVPGNKQNSFNGHTGVDFTVANIVAVAGDGGNWAYNVVANSGQISINCTHKDSKNSDWNSW